MSRFYCSLRTIIHAFHAAFATEFPVGPVIRNNYGFCGTLLYTYPAVVAVIIGNKCFCKYIASDKIVPESNWRNQYIERKKDK